MLHFWGRYSHNKLYTLTLGKIIAPKKKKNTIGEVFHAFLVVPLYDGTIPNSVGCLIVDETVIFS